MTPIWAARGAFTEGGLQKIDAEDMERALVSKVYGADFNAADDAFELQGSTRPVDLDTQLQVLAAYVSSPGFRPEAYLRMKSYGRTLLDQMAATPEGVLSRDLSRLTHGGDARFAFPTAAQIDASTPDRFKAALAPNLSSGPLEVLVAGDIDVDTAVKAVARTLGALPAPKDAAPSANARTVALPAPMPEPLVLRHKGRADQAIGYAAWRTRDFFADPHETRVVRVLAEVLQNRLLDDLRESQGATYSPESAATASQVFPGYGYVFATVEIPPQKLASFQASVLKSTADLRDKPVTEDELDRARRPMLEQLQKARQSNEYWLAQLSGAAADPRRIDAIRSVVADTAGVTPADIQKAARTYLTDDRLWRLDVRPESVDAKK